MLSTRILFKALATLVLIIGLATFAFADTVRLKDGSIIKGKIISFSAGKFVMLIGQGERQRQMTFFSDEIESIEFDNGPITVPPASTSAVTGNEQPDTGERPPNYTEKTDGNQTIITVGSSRDDRRSTVPDRSDDGSANVDPNAVAVDPSAGATNSGPPELKQPDSGLVIDNTPISGDPVGEDQPASADPTKPAPVRIPVTVMADDTSNGWTNAGWVVKKGQKIRIISNGRISLGNGRTSGPQGISTLPDPNKLIKDRPTGSLIAVIGDDNNDFIFIGENREFVAQRDGSLFLGVNEGNLSDNSGSFDVIVEVEAPGN